MENKNNNNIKKQQEEIKRLREKYYKFYDDVKNHNNGYEDW